jgi:hypothetical protein
MTGPSFPTLTLETRWRGSCPPCRRRYDDNSGQGCGGHRALKTVKADRSTARKMAPVGNGAKLVEQRSVLNVESSAIVPFRPAIGGRDAP